MELIHTTTLNDNKTQVDLKVVYQYTHQDLADNEYWLDTLQPEEIYEIVSITHDDEEIMQFIQEYRQELENEIIEKL